MIDSHLPNNNTDFSVSPSDIKAVLTCILLAFLIIILIFCLFIRSPYKTGGTETAKSSFQSPQPVFLTDSQTLRKAISIHSPKTLLYPDTVYPFAFAGDLKISAVDTDFSIPNPTRISADTQAIPDLQFTIPQQRVLSADIPVAHHSQEYEYPVFTTESGLLEVPHIALSRSAERQLRQNPPTAPTILRIAPDAFGSIVEIISSSGNFELDFAASRHLETFLSTADCPESVLKNIRTCRVVWSNTVFSDLAEKGMSGQ